MPVTARSFSKPISPDDLDIHFIRKLRNFMNNWEVSGGSFQFDGYKVKLRVAPRFTAGVSSHPWKVTRSDDGLTKRVIVKPGAINSLVPTDIFEPIPITGTGTEYIVLTMTSTGGNPVSASLSKETTYPVPSSTTPTHPPTECKDVIAVLYDGVVYQIRNTNLIATSVEVYQETVDSPAPGERQYIPWYRWEVGVS